MKKLLAVLLLVVSFSSYALPPDQEAEDVCSNAVWEAVFQMMMAKQNGMSFEQMQKHNKDFAKEHKWHDGLTSAIEELGEVVWQEGRQDEGEYAKAVKECTIYLKRITVNNS